MATRPYAEAARALLHTTLLDAVRDQLRERPWREVSMAGVASAAGVSRQTLYNAFGSRDELAAAYVLRETDAFLAAVETSVRAHPEDLVDAIAAAFGVFLEAAADHPLVRALVAGDDDDLLPLVTTQGEPVLGRATGRLVAVLQECWPALESEDARLLAEVAVRLAISHVLLPSPITPDALRRLLAPYAARIGMAVR